MVKVKEIIYLIFLFIPSLLLIIYCGNLSDKPYFSGVILIYLVYVFLISYIYFEKSNRGLLDVTFIATMSSFAAISRVPFAVIPNVQPVTFLIAMSGLVFGPFNGFIIGATTAFVSNIFLGQGPWTLYQMMAWGIIGVLSGFLGLKNKKPSKLSFSIILFLFGILFGWIMNLWHVIAVIKDITFNNIMLTYTASIYFDLMHGVGNIIFVILFYNNFYRLLMRFKTRTHYVKLKKGRCKNE